MIQKAIFIAILFLPLVFLNQCKEEKTNFISKDQELFDRIIDINRHQLAFKKFLKKETINSSDVQIKIKNYSVSQIENISDRIYFIEIQYNYKGTNWRAEAYRLIGIAIGQNNKNTYFYDSEIYMPECGWDFFKSLDNLYSLEINGTTLLVFNEINKSVICDVVKEKTITRFYNVKKQYKKIYELETKFINYEEDQNSREPLFSSVLIYSNMCSSSCKAITFLFFKDNKISDTQTLTVDQSGDKLVQYQ